MKRSAKRSECLAAIRGFVAHVRANESGTLRYDVWQERDAPTRFVHVFVFRDAEAPRIHSALAQVKAFAATLYPRCLAPAEFVNYRHEASKQDVLLQAGARRGCAPGTRRFFCAGIPLPGCVELSPVRQNQRPRSRERATRGRLKSACKGPATTIRTRRSGGRRPALFSARSG